MRADDMLSYYVKNMKALWQQKVEPHLPVLKSIIALPESDRAPPTGSTRLRFIGVTP